MKTILKLLIVYFLFTATSVLSKVQAADCCAIPPECGLGWHECQVGTWCCLDPGGCPSYECPRIPGCTWDSGNNICEHDNSCDFEREEECELVPYCQWNPYAGCMNWQNCDVSMYGCNPCVGCKACTPSAPTPPALISPANGTACITTPTVVLDWNPVVSWGTGCPSNSNTYEVYVNGTLQATYDEGTTQHTYAVTMGNNYTWFVRAKNGSDQMDSATYSFSTGACARIVGRVWTDVNNNGTYSGASEAWSRNPPPGAGCSYATDNDIDVRWPAGASVLNNWQCNTASYYTTLYYSLTGGLANVTVELTTPDAADYPRKYAAWNFNSLNAGGQPINVASGTNDYTAEVTITNQYGTDWSNHLQWQVKPNTPPTANVLNNPPTPPANQGNTGAPYYQPMSFYGTGSTIGFNVLATDVPTDVANWRIQLGRRPFDPATRTAGDPFTEVSCVPGGNCTGPYITCAAGGSCTGSFRDTVQAGYYVYYPYVRDEISLEIQQKTNNQCNGHPGVHNGTVTGWADCDTDHTNGYQDENIILGVVAPSCNGVSGNSQLFLYPDPPGSLPFKYPENIGFYSMDVASTAQSEIRHVWQPWVNPGNGSAFPTLTQIKIYARGVQTGGVWPIMQAWAGTNSDGTRTQQNICRWNSVNGACEGSALNMSVNYTTFQEYRLASSVSNMSSFDVVFTNDSNNDLYIDRIEYTYEVGPGASDTKIIYPYAAAGWGNAKVFYDRGFGGGGNLRREFDGADKISLVSGNSNHFPGDPPNWTFSAGAMPWSGSLSFPVPLRSPIATGNTSLTASPRISGVSSSCTLTPIAVVNPTYIVDGAAYERSDSTCPSTMAARIQNATVRVVDSAGNEIPLYQGNLFHDTTDITGYYRMTGIPLGYKQGSLGCPNCGVKICMDQLDPDNGAYAMACQNANPWANQTLCTDVIPAQSYPPTPTVTMNMGFDRYNNQKWTSVIDGDFYAYSVSLDVAAAPNTTLFQPYVINTRDNTTKGGFGFVDTVVDLGSPLTKTNIAEGGGAANSGYALSLLNAAPSYNFKDKWFDGYTVTPPSHANVRTNQSGIVSGGMATFDSSFVYHFTSAAEFNNRFYTAASSYSIIGANSTVLVYVTGDASSTRLTLNKKLRAVDANRGMVVITNLPVRVTTDTSLEVPETLLFPTQTYSASAASFGSPALTDGYIDFAIISTGTIEFSSDYDQTVNPVIYDLPIMLYGGLASSSRIEFNRDLFHVYNSDFPAEMIRLNPRVLPNLTGAERGFTSTSSFTGLSQIDIQTPYE